MKVVILAGGAGTRLAEYTNDLPKPMVPIGELPILVHIMEIYARYGFEEFVIAAGYRSTEIKRYFMDFYALSSDLSIDLENGELQTLHRPRRKWKITIVDTGIATMTGGRIKRLQPYLNETFMLTYGDGVADIDLRQLLDFHKEHERLVTVTAVHPSARFGELSINPVDDRVVSFKEKPQTAQGWINGGFFVIEPAFLDYIEDDSTVLEAEPLERAAAEGQLVAFRHDKFWHCMDTLRDKIVLENLVKEHKAPWMKGGK